MARKLAKECYRCGDTATIFADDYGSGILKAFCGPCREQHRSGYDEWVHTGIARGKGPRNGRNATTRKETTMQTLANKGRHIAEWGGYQVSIQVMDVGSLVVVRDAQTPYKVHFEKNVGIPEAAIEAAAGWLEERGCKAFVDGQRRKLQDFLFFVPSGG